MIDERFQDQINNNYFMSHLKKNQVLVSGEWLIHDIMKILEMSVHC